MKDILIIFGTIILLFLSVGFICMVITVGGSITGRFIHKYNAQTKIQVISILREKEGL